MNQTINKNTYYQIPRYLIALVFSNQRNGKYKATKTELKNGWTFIVNIPGLNLQLNVPFKAILKDNNKIKGIKGYNFSTARGCRSYRLGFCQVGNIHDCYALVGEERNKNDLTNNGGLKMNSSHQINLNMHFNHQVKNHPEVLNRFIDYLNNKIPYLRFNVNGDFRNQSDINLLIKICLEYTGVCYGYTAANDLEIKPLQKVAAVNGSNKYYTNKYTCTFSLETFFNAILQGKNCLGGCINCSKCWTLKDTEIINLFHKKDSDIILNTYANRQFIVKLLNAFNVPIVNDNLKKYKGIYYSLNAFLKGQGVDLQDLDVNNIKEFLYFIIDSHYDIQDNISVYDKDALKELGII